MPSTKSDLTTLTREGWPLCAARKKDGTRCLAFAGSGTDHRGTGRCRFHLGNTRSHRQHAVVKDAEARMVTMGLPVEVSASEALLWVVHATAGHAAWLAQEIAALDPAELTSHDGRVLVEAYGQERDRLTRAAKAALDAGADARQLDLAEKFAAVTASVIGVILRDLDVYDDPRAPEVVERAIAALERSPGQLLTAGAVG